MSFRLLPEQHELLQGALTIAAREMAVALGVERVKPVDALIYLATRVVEGQKAELPTSAAVEEAFKPYRILYRTCPCCRTSQIATPAGWVDVPWEVVQRVEDDAEKIVLPLEAELEPQVAGGSEAGAAPLGVGASGDAISQGRCPCCQRESACPATGGDPAGGAAEDAAGAEAEGCVGGVAEGADADERSGHGAREPEGAARPPAEEAREPADPARAPADDAPCLPSRANGRSETPEEEGDSTRITSLGNLETALRARRQELSAYVVVLAGSNLGEMQIDGPENVIGRAASAQLRLNDEGISRRHCRIITIGGRVIVEDLGSANGTLVNDEIIQHHELKEGDKIRLGANTLLKFTYQDKLDETFQQQMYDAALRDGLTKCYNKKFFLDRLDTEFAYARRHKTMLSLVMFDVDDFKRVNDTYGHLAGDEVLRRPGRIRCRWSRGTDDVRGALRRRGVRAGHLPEHPHRRRIEVAERILGERIRSGRRGAGRRLPGNAPAERDRRIGVAAMPEVQATVPAARSSPPTRRSTRRSAPGETACASTARSRL